jgi:hypothetical protein
LWAAKGALLRALSQCQRLLHADPALWPRLDKLFAVRQELARLILSPAPELKDDARRALLRDLTDRKEALERELAERIPEEDRLDARKLPQPADRADKLPADGAFVDLFNYRAWDVTTGAWAEYRYAAFVLVKGRPVRRVELGDAAAIDKGLGEWRAALLAQPVTERGLPRDESPADRAAHRHVAVTEGGES